MPPKNLFWHFCAPRQLLVQSEAKILIELLNIFFIDNTDLIGAVTDNHTARRNVVLI